MPLQVTTMLNHILTAQFWDRKESALNVPFWTFLPSWSCSFNGKTMSNHKLQLLLHTTYPYIVYIILSPQFRDIGSFVDLLTT